jgi:hypothetical protein
MERGVAKVASLFCYSDLKFFYNYLYVKRFLLWHGLCFMVHRIGSVKKTSMIFRDGIETQQHN